MGKAIKNFINGVAVGITEIVPGVSGGTIAVILGFYDEFITTLNHFRENYKKSLKFFVPLLLGMVAGILAFSSVIHYLLTNFSFPTVAFFIGLNLGIIPIIFSKVKEPGRKFELRKIVAAISPVLVLVTLSFFKGASVTEPAEMIRAIDLPFMLFILLGGVVAAAALVIPGVSGSFMLLLLGLYPLVTYALSSIGPLFTGAADVPPVLDVCKVLGPLLIGILIGGLSMARLIERLLKKHYAVVYSIILGLLIGSVYALFTRPVTFQSGISAPMIVIAVLTFACGAILSFKLGQKRL